MRIENSDRPNARSRVLRARILADFHNFHFTWSGFFRWTGITIAAFIIAALTTLYFLDWNQMRGPLARYLSYRTGRAVRIEGTLSVKLLTLTPRIDAGGFYVGNPGWVTQSALGRSHFPQALKVRTLTIECRLVPLIFGHLVLPLVRLDEPELLVVRDASGRTNWDASPIEHHVSTHDQPLKLPPINRFAIRNGRIEIFDAVRKLDFTGSFSSQENEGQASRASFLLDGQGSLNANDFSAKFQGGPLLDVSESRPYDFGAAITMGATHAQITGSILRPFNFGRYDAKLKVTGPSLADLYLLTGVVLPNTPAYALSASVQRQGMLYRFDDINAVLGHSDLVGYLTLDASGKVPTLAGKVASRSLNFADLGPVVGSSADRPQKSRYLLPDTVMHTERLRQTNAEVNYSAASIKSRDFPLTGLDTHISLESGVLNLAPLAFSFTQGRLAGSLKIDARKAVPVTTVDARISDIHADSFIKSKNKPITGVLEARALLTGRGNSVHRAASTADGKFTAVVTSGSMRHSLAEWTGIDVLAALSLNLSGNTANTDLRCAVAQFSARNGLMTAQNIVIDTDPVRIDGSGTIDLRNETLNLRLQGKPKKFRFLRLRAPITMKGPWAHPAVGVNARSAIEQGAIAAGLGLLNPFASILAFVDPGLANNANCGQLLSQAKAQGAPVKAAAIGKAVTQDHK